MSGAASALGRLDLPIRGMTCVRCAAKVEAALAAVAGVRAARVNFASETATVEGDAAVGALLGAVAGAGYQVALATVELPVEGADCASCVGRIEDHVDALPGIVSRQLDLARASLHAEYVPGLVTPQAIADRVIAAGYRVPAVPPPEQAEDALERSRRAVESDHRRRLAVALPLVAPHLLHMVLGGHGAGGDWAWFTPQRQAALATPVVFYAGWPFIAGAWRAARARSADMNSLIAIGTLTAWTFSMAILLRPDAFAAAGATTVYFDAAAEIVALVLIGRWLEARARRRTGDALQALLRLAPRTARRRHGDREETVAVEALVAGDLVVVPVGERVPVDGVVAEGASDLDTAALTGEPVPRPVAAGDEVQSGTINLTGRLVLRATRVGDESTVRQIARLVRAAQGSRAPVQRLADRLSAVFVPAVASVAGLAAATWYTVGPEPRLANAVVAAVTTLIIACPCALGLATPTAIMVGVGRAARAGVLFKDAAAIERLRHARVLALDKTGTLTVGRPQVVALYPAAATDEAALLAAAAAAERGHGHPFASGILAAAAARGLSAEPAPDRTRSAPGGGVVAWFGERAVYVGSPAWVSAEAGVAAPPMVEGDAGPVSRVGVAERGRWLGTIALADTMRADAPAALERLRRSGLRLVLLSGDRRPVAAALARAAGIDEVHAELSPRDKLAQIGRLRRAHGPVIMIGDGINDAPALAEADVGIAIDGGSDVAAETGDVVILGGGWDRVVAAVALGRTTLRTVRENLFLSLIYNALAIPAAAGALYPLWGVRLMPWMAAAAMALSDVSVIGNSLRLRRRPLRL